MRPKTMILFVVAIGCGLVASIGVSQYIDKAGKGGQKVETMKVYTAKTEINIGEKLDDKNISLEEWPKDRVPEGAVVDLKILENKYPRSRLYKGEVILVAKLSDTVDGNKAQTIPEGFRVVSVKVNVETSAGGLVRPGDRVDLVVYLRKSAEVPQTGTKTVLSNVNVFAVDAETDRAVDKGSGQSREARTVSLLVTPKQAETVLLAKELGPMSLSLRRPGEVKDEASSGMTIDEFLGNDTEKVRDKKPVPTKDNGLAGWLSAASKVATVAVKPMPPAPIDEAPPKFVMKVRTSEGDREYRWKELEGEPIEVGSESTAPTRAAKPSATVSAPARPVVRFAPPANQTAPSSASDADANPSADMTNDEND